MTNIKAKLATGAITLAFLASTLVPAAFADTKVVIKGNGAGSKNTVTVKNKNKVKVEQTNSTAVVNLVGVFQNTGGNEANKNTGGDVTVNSGDATSTVSNTTTTGSNLANVDPCACQNGDTTVKIKDNGAGSKNKVTVTNENETKVTQTNETFVLNGVLVAQNTGGNEANKNTGGSVDVGSGNADSTVTNTTITGSNILNP